MKETLHRNTNKDCFYREENFKAIINSALVGFYLVNREGQILDANDAYCSMIGYSHEELLNMEIKDIEDVESGETVGERIQRIAEKGSGRYEAKHKRKDGNFIFIEASVHYLKDEQGMLSVFIRDIVERKQADEAFQKLIQKDEEALRIARMGHWELDLATRQFTFNDQYYSLHGTTVEEAGGYIMSVEEFASRYIHQDDACLIDEAIRSTIETNDPNIQLQHEARIRHADGELRDVLVWFRGEKDAQGRITKMRGVNQDITKRKRVETELVLANKELVFQNAEKEKRAEELVLANKELRFQNEEKEKRAAELVIANKELAFQNQEKEKRAAELAIANKELVFQNAEKEKRAEELGLANKELHFQNEEKEKRAAELVIANEELAFQNAEKEKRAAELLLANEETLRSLQNIQALHKIDQAIAGSLDLNLTLNVVLEQVKAQLNIDAAAILLLNPHSQVLEFSAGLGFRSNAIERSYLRLGEGASGRAALERRTVSVTNLFENSSQFNRVSLLAEEGFSTCFATPLIAKGQVNGVLEIYHRLPFTPDKAWLKFLKILAGQAAIAVDSANLVTALIHSNAELFAAYETTIEGWSHALDLRDKETEGHTQRVTEMTIKLARAAGITEAELVHIRRGALLHDIGKMGVPDHILLKPGKLTDEEWVAMRKHAIFAFELLSPIAYLHPALNIPYCHHEKWDGSGYPRGLKGEQIPLEARLFAIVDVWDALRSDRPYREGWSKEKVAEHIKSRSGTHFDPKAVELFLNMLNEDEKNAG